MHNFVTKLALLSGMQESVWCAICPCLSRMKPVAHEKRKRCRIYKNQNFPKRPSVNFQKKYRITKASCFEWYTSLVRCFEPSDSLQRTADAQGDCRGLRRCMINDGSGVKCVGPGESPESNRRSSIAMRWCESPLFEPTSIKTERAGCRETKPIILNIKFLGQLNTFEAGSMTRKPPNYVFSRWSAF